MCFVKNLEELQRKEKIMAENVSGGEENTLLADVLAQRTPEEIHARYVCIF